MLTLYTNLAPFLSFGACFFQTRGQEWNPLKSHCDAERLSLFYFFSGHAAVVVSENFPLKPADESKDKQSVVQQQTEQRDSTSHVPW